MARKYHLRDSGAYDPLNDPDAAWRKEPASERQIRRIEFFTGQRMSGLTKGKAGAIIDRLNDDTKRLADYESWKVAGEPNIARWHRGQARGCAAFFGKALVAFAVVGLAALAVILFWLPHSVETASKLAPEPTTPVIERKVAQPSQSLPSVSPAGKVASPLPVASPSPVPSPSPATEDAQRLAVKFHPALGVAGSSLNLEFVTRYKRYRADKPEFFNNPSWPLALAEESVQAVAAKR